MEGLRGWLVERMIAGTEVMGSSRTTDTPRAPHRRTGKHQVRCSQLSDVPIFRNIFVVDGNPKLRCLVKNNFRLLMFFNVLTAQVEN